MKKIISAILALAMCISLFAGITVSAAEARPNGRYDFIVNYANDTKGSQYGALKNDGYAGGFNIYDVKGYGAHGWKGLGVDFEQTDAAYTFRYAHFSNSGIQVRHSYSGVPDVSKNIRIAVLLEAPAVGSYLVKSNIGSSYSGINIYMGRYKDDITPIENKADLSGYMNPENYVGESVANNTGFSNGNLSSWNSTGKYIYSDGVTPIVFLVDVPDTAATGSNADAILRSVYLESTSAAPTLQVGNTYLDIGDTSSIAVRHHNTKANTNMVVNSFVDYYAADGEMDVVKIDDNGVVTAIKKGTEQIVAKYAGKEHVVTFTVRGEDDAKTYYFRYAQASNSFVGIDANKYTGASAIFVNSLENHGWKFFGFSANAEAYADDGNYFRLAQMDDGDINLRNTYGNIPNLPYIETGFELEAPKREGFYQISMQTSTCYRWFYTGPIEEGKDDVEDYIDVPITDYVGGPYPTDDPHFVAQTAMANNYSVSIDYPRLVYSDGTTPMFLGFNLRDGGLMTLSSYTLIPVSGEAELKVEDSALEIGETTTAAVYVGEKTLVNSFVTFNSSNSDVAKVTDYGIVEAKSVGETTITATVGNETYTATVTVYEEDTALKNAFTAKSEETSYIAPDVTGLLTDGTIIDSKDNGDGSFNLTAPAEKEGKGKFLYWAKALDAQKIILLNQTNELVNYIPGEKGDEYLIAVYEGDVSGADEYYNANGQLIPGATQATKVSMAGFGTSTGWQKYRNTNIYVAEYELIKPEANIVITTQNCTTDKEKYAFGDLVTCTAQNPGEKIFKCWMKNGEIVSCDTAYAFKAWENCTVTAVYVDNEFHYTGSKIKILIDEFAAGDETGVMAEFIGFGKNVVEKGIMFSDGSDTSKIAMTTKNNQFTVIADKAGEYIGYAILKSGDAYTLITDGLYTK